MPKHHHLIHNHHTTHTSHTSPHQPHQPHHHTTSTNAHSPLPLPTHHHQSHHQPHHHLLHTHVEPKCHEGDHLSHSIDLVTTLRSELAASTYKRDRLLTDLSEIKTSLCTRETECESLRAQTARQSTLITSLQNRLQAAETRERNLQVKSESCTQSLQRDKRSLEEKCKELQGRLRRIECELNNEEGQKEQARTQLHDLVRRLCLALGIDVCEQSHLTPETVLTKTTDVVAELTRLRAKAAATCETLQNCEAELVNTRSISCAEKQRLQAQLDTLTSLNKELECRCRQNEKNVELTRNRLAESEVAGDKLREELRGFESRCSRLQTTMDRFQSDRLQFLRNIASLICVPEPCETLIKDKTREIVNENQSLSAQVNTLREQIQMEAARHRESHESLNCRIRTEEGRKCELEERLDKANNELQNMRAEHITLGEYLVRLARALCWSECAEPPSHGTDAAILGESLLERGERLALHHEHHAHGACDKHCADNHHHHLPKLRRERSCHDLPIKESSALYSLQRRVRVLREQVQRRDLHLELLRRKIALLEDGARGKSIAQGERDNAISRARQSAKQAERTSQQLIEAKAQLAELKVQLAEAAEYKITALERARKIDELQARAIELENEKVRLQSQLATYKTRIRSAAESTNERRIRDESQINGLREELTRIKSQLSETNHRLSQLQVFRTSVARILHLRDLPECDILQRLQTLCNAHQEFTLLSRRYESTSPVVDDLVPSSTQCRPLSSSPSHHHHHHSGGQHHAHNHHHSRQSHQAHQNHQNHQNHHHHHHNHKRYDESAYNDDNFLDDDFDFNKKY